MRLTRLTNSSVSTFDFVFTSIQQLGWGMLYKEPIQAFRARISLPPYPDDVTPSKQCQDTQIIMA